MKRIIVWLIRLLLVAAPAYSVYEFAMQNDGDLQSLIWWKDNAQFILWTLGAYLLLLIISFNRVINWKQTVLLLLASLILVYFYYTPDIYKLFLDLDYFQDENRSKLPYVPYAFVVLIFLLNRLLKRRYKLKN